MRSTWIAQEVLTTLDEELSEVALIPGTGGIFEIKVNNELLWSLKNEGRLLRGNHGGIQISKSTI